MKVRLQFVSNSSSSSFVLDKRKMTEHQIDAVRDHIRYADEHFPGQFYIKGSIPGLPFPDAWSETEDGDIINLYTSMDNFDMRTFLKYIHVDQEAIIAEE